MFLQYFCICLRELRNDTKILVKTASLRIWIQNSKQQVIYTEDVGSML